MGAWTHVMASVCRHPLAPLFAALILCALFRPPAHRHRLHQFSVTEGRKNSGRARSTAKIPLAGRRTAHLACTATGRRYSTAGNSAAERSPFRMPSRQTIRRGSENERQTSRHWLRRRTCDLRSDGVRWRGRNCHGNRLGGDLRSSESNLVPVKALTPFQRGEMSGTG